MKVGVQVINDKTKEVRAAVAALSRTKVYVGIPAAEGGRSGEPMNNATLGYIHEFGSPARNIPARPFLIPGIKNAQKEIVSQLKKVGKTALSGDVQAVEKGLHSVGILVQSAVRKKITDGPFAPLAVSTLKNRARKGRKGAAAEIASRAAGNAPNPENARPLIDTAQMRRAITYILKRGR